MLAIKSDTRYRLKQKESNTQWFERNLLKWSKKASHPFFLHCAQCFTYPSPFSILFLSSMCFNPFSTILLFSLLNVFIPSSTIFIIFSPQCFLFPSSTSTSTSSFLWVTISHGRRGRLSFRCSIKKSAVVWENEERLPVKWSSFLSGRFRSTFWPYLCHSCGRCLMYDILYWFQVTGMNNWGRNSNPAPPPPKKCSDYGECFASQ